LSDLLPTDRPRSARQSFSAGYQSFTLSAELSQALKKLSRQQSVSLFMVFLAAFKTLLYRLTRQDDIIVGTAIAGRNRRETEALIGCFVNMLALRTDLSGNPPFSELLKRVREVSLGAFAHQDLPYEKLLEGLRSADNNKETWQIQTACGIWNAPVEKLELPGLTTKSLILENDAMRVDLILWLVDAEQGMRVKWKFNAALFEEATITRLHSRFVTLLHNIVAEPEARINRLEIISEDEKQQQILRERKREEEKLNKFKALRRKTKTLTPHPPQRSSIDA
jgi:non-ribosomal peptide synthetase component F